MLSNYSRELQKLQCLLSKSLAFPLGSPRDPSASWCFESKYEAWETRQSLEQAKSEATEKPWKNIYSTKQHSYHASASNLTPPSSLQAHSPQQLTELVEIKHAHHILLSEDTGTGYKGKIISVHSHCQCGNVKYKPEHWITYITVIKIITEITQRFNHFNKMKPLMIPKIDMLTTCPKHNQNEHDPDIFEHIKPTSETKTKKNHDYPSKKVTPGVTATMMW